ncbi:MAG: alginate lyase family protein [Syntrophotaleaceae bacterium]
MLNRFSLFIRALMRLGPANIGTVFTYRLVLRSGLFERFLPAGQSYAGDLFHAKTPTADLDKRPPVLDAAQECAEALIKGDVPYFSSKVFSTGSPPAWFDNPADGSSYAEPWRHWSTIADFDPAIGDIKIIWEISRFDWALVFARVFQRSGDPRYLHTLNLWAADWIAQNPLNVGPNWKCGQEASIRLMQVLLAAVLLNQHKNPTASLVRFAEEHCRRIEPTIRYAIAQNNNHGTSEATALFVGGAWLESLCTDDSRRRQAGHWRIKGRKWLENRVKKLIQPDGSFSQNSVNYHRLLVDTLSMVEFWRRELQLAKFSDQFYARCRATVIWLYQMVDKKSGDAPNLGANDGARLFLLSNTSYRDFRPSVQLGAVLFLGSRLYGKGAWDEPLDWLKLLKGPIPSVHIPKDTKLFRDGGYVVIVGAGAAWGLWRYPKFRFRPGHADAFHLDLWHQGVNVLRDAGSFSYHAAEPWRSYFSSVKSHNTVEIDAQNQHLPISRFLRASMLQLDLVGDLNQSKAQASWTGSYRHTSGARHTRTVICLGTLWRIVDKVEKCQSSVVLRWRLAPGDWSLEGTHCRGELMDFTVISDVPIKRCDLVEGWESRCYLEKSRVPVVEVEVAANTVTLTTNIHLKY